MKTRDNRRQRLAIIFVLLALSIVTTAQAQPGVAQPSAPERSGSQEVVKKSKPKFNYRENLFLENIQEELDITNKQSQDVVDILEDGRKKERSCKDLKLKEEENLCRITQRQQIRTKLSAVLTPKELKRLEVLLQSKKTNKSGARRQSIEAKETTPTAEVGKGFNF